MPTNQTYNNHFDLTLDTLAPTGTLTYSGSSKVNQNVTINHTYGTAVRKVFWTDQVASQTIKAYTAGVAYAKGNIVDYDSDIYLVTTAFTATGTWNTDKANLTEISWTQAGETVSSAFNSQGTNYVHMILKDAVNNMSDVITSSGIFYDNVRPVINAFTHIIPIEGTSQITTSRRVNLRYKVEDAAPSSGVKKIWAEGTDLAQVVLSEATSSKEIVLDDTVEIEFNAGCADGHKTVNIYAIDEAGNLSADYTTGIELDTAIGAVNTIVYKADGETVLPTNSIISFAEVGETSTKTTRVSINYPGSAKAYAVWYGRDMQEHQDEIPFVAMVAEGTLATSVDYVFEYGEPQPGVIDQQAIFVAIKTTDNTVLIDMPAVINDDFTVDVSQCQYITACSNIRALKELVKVNVVCDDNDLAAYAVWWGEDKATEAIDFVYLETPGEINVTVDLDLGSEDGAKVIRAAVKDRSDLVSKADPITIFVDSTYPTITEFNTSSSVIGRETGYKDSIISITALDPEKDSYASGIATWKLSCTHASVTNTLAEGTGANVPTSYTFRKADDATATEGDYLLELKVVDKAGNSNTTDTTIKYDKTAPETTITLNDIATNNWYNQKPSATLNIVEAGAGFGTNGTDYHAAALYAWVDTTQGNTTIPAGASKLAPHTGTYAVAAANIYGDCSDSATNYLHVQITDNVGNTSTTEQVFKYDATAPNKPTITWNSKAYNTATAGVTINYSDATSGIWQMKVEANMQGTWTNLVSGNDGWEAAATSKGINLTGGDGIKKVRVTVKDYAGNVSEVSAEDSTEYDTTAPIGALQLRKAGGTEELKAVVRDVAFKAHIYNMADDSGSGSVGDIWYRVSGNFTTSPIEWIKATESVVDIDNLAFTTGDGKKTITVEFRDNAENRSSVSQSVTLDTTLPGVNITNLDHQIISKVHTKRDVAGATCNCYADEVKFTITPSEEMNAYKICAFDTISSAQAAYASATDKNAWVESLVAIPGDDMARTYGTPGVSGTTETVSIILNGTNYETALVARGLVAGGTAEGAHAVIVFVKDLGGNWSTPTGTTVENSAHNDN